MSEITTENTRELSYKFLYSLKTLVEEKKINNIKISEVWEKMNVNYDKDTVLPNLIDQLIDSNYIKQGKNKDEVKIIIGRKEKTPIYILSLFNNIVNEDEGNSIGVILNINGLIISGNLISLKKYYDLFQKAYAHHLPV